MASKPVIIIPSRIGSTRNPSRVHGGTAFGQVPRIEWETQIKPDRRNRIRIGMNSMLIKTPDSNILVDTGAGNNSVFGKTLIQALKNSESAISLGEIGLSIGYAHANMDQMPIYATYNHWGHGGGDFVFIPKKN